MSKRSSPSCSDGLTLVELLVAATVVLAVTSAAIAFALASRRLVDRDAARVELVESVRAAREFLVTDLRQAGERLSDDFPAIEIGDGVSGRPDTVVVRRNLLDTVLQVCVDLTPSSEKIAVATPGGGGTGACAVAPDDDGDGWPDNVQAWRERRRAAGGALVAYVFDPVARVGEFFPYVDDNATSLTLTVDSAHSWARAYPAANMPRVYLLEERRYDLDGDVLRIVINGEDGRALRVVDHLSDLQLTAIFRDGSRHASLGPSDRWAMLASIEVAMRAESQVSGNTVERGWTGIVLPRNVLSR